MRRLVILVIVLALFVTGIVWLTRAQTTPATISDADRILAAMPLFTQDDPWRKDVSKSHIDPRSDDIIASIGPAKPLHPDFGKDFGIPFQIVDKTTPTYLPKIADLEESDRGPYPIPDDAIIEGGPNAPLNSDRHLICVDKDTWRLYELFGAVKTAGGWSCGSAALFDLTKTSVGQRQDGWTSADAAGLPIFPGLVRFDEAAITRKIDHALRFTVKFSRHAYISPATHYASARTDPALPPMGMRVRLKANVDISTFPETDQVVLTALKKYGMMVADNGGDWFLSGSPDSRWNDEEIDQLKRITGRDFEVVKMGD